MGFFNNFLNSESKDQGVVINGVRWATRNVDIPGKFAVSPEATGKLYQWNRKIAWATTGDVTDWNNTVPAGSSWLKSNDPSPSGWRVPTFEELGKLLDRDKVTSEWITQNGVTGRKFTDKISDKFLFLPAVGSRGPDGRFAYEGMFGSYWSSEMYIDETNAYILLFALPRIDWHTGFLREGLSVRAVAE